MALAPLVTAWSYSRYGDYTQCPAKFKYKHIDRLPDPGSPAMERGNVIHKLAETFVAGGGPGTGGKRRPAPVPPELANFRAQFIELQALKPYVEQAWGFKSDWSHIGRPGWFGDDVWFRAKADVAIVYDDNTGEAIDHKTGKKYGENEDQVGLMALATRQRFPALTHVTARLWYLDDPNPDTQETVFEYSGKELDAIQRTWTKKVVPMFSDRKFAPRPNDKCHWCPFSKAKGGPCKF